MKLWNSLVVAGTVVSAIVASTGVQAAVASRVPAATAATAPAIVTSPVFQGVSFALPSGGGATVGYSRDQGAGKELRFDLGFDLSKASGADTTFGLSVEVGFRRYLTEAGKVKIYHQPGVFVAKAATGEFTEALSLGGSYSIGGEYWVSPNFSFGARAGVSLNISNKFKAFALKTGTSAVMATYYW